MTEPVGADVVVVPPDQLPADTLASVIEAYVNREGTDYGSVEYSLEAKVAQVQRALARREAFLVFDPQTESCSIVPPEALPPSLR